jgi:hypothetical protein
VPLDGRSACVDWPVRLQIQGRCCLITTPGGDHRIDTGRITSSSVTHGIRRMNTVQLRQLRQRLLTLIAAKATFAMKLAIWLRRDRLNMFPLATRYQRRNQVGKP